MYNLRWYKISLYFFRTFLTSLCSSPGCIKVCDLPPRFAVLCQRLILYSAGQLAYKLPRIGHTEWRAMWRHLPPSAAARGARPLTPQCHQLQLAVLPSQFFFVIFTKTKKPTPTDTTCFFLFFLWRKIICNYH